jgi:hypothetical protein
MLNYKHRLQKDSNSKIDIFLSIDILFHTLFQNFKILNLLKISINLSGIDF